MSYLADLQNAILHTHAATSEWVKTVPVTEIFRGEVAWKGVVEVFTVSHPKAKQCFAWGVRRENGKGWDVTAVLAIPPVTTPELAVKAAIAARARQANPRQ